MMRIMKIGLVMALLALSSCFATVPPTHAPTREKLPPKIAVYHNNRGVRLLHEQKIDQAENEFKTAVEASPDYPEALSNLGLVYKYKGEFDQAVVYFKRAIKADKKWAAPHNHLGTATATLNKTPIPWRQKTNSHGSGQFRYRPRSE